MLLAYLKNLSVFAVSVAAAVAVVVFVWFKHVIIIFFDCCICNLVHSYLHDPLTLDTIYAKQASQIAISALKICSKCVSNALAIHIYTYYNDNVVVIAVILFTSIFMLHALFSWCKLNYSYSSFVAIHVDVSFTTIVSTSKEEKREKNAHTFMWLNSSFLIIRCCYEMNDNKVCVCSVHWTYIKCTIQHKRNRDKNKRMEKVSLCGRERARKRENRRDETREDMHWIKETRQFNDAISTI